MNLVRMRPRTGRAVIPVLLALGLAGVAAAGCGSDNTSGGTAGDATSAQDSNIPVVDEFLLPPDDAESFEAKQTEPVTAPTSGGEMSLPYSHVLPLPEGPVGDPEKTYTFCFSQALTGSTWAVAQADSVLIEAARHPNVEILASNTANDPLKQVADLDACMARNVDGILVWPHSVEPLTPQIEKMTNAGFVVVGMERTVATRDYASWIFLDNPKATGDLAEAVCEQTGGEGVVVETDGAVGSSPQILRRAGFLTALSEKCPNVTVEFTAPTDYSRAQGYKVALDYLQANQSKDIRAWYTQYTEIGIGVDRALKDFDKDIPQFSIVDGKVAVGEVQKGTFAAIAPWTPVHGDVALRAAIRHVTEQEVPKDIVLVQPPLIDAANAAEQVELTWPG